MDLIKGKSSLSTVNNYLSLLRLELPRNLVFCMSHEANFEFSEHIDLVIFRLVILMSQTHIETECLTHNVVKWHCKEVATKYKQDHPIHPVKLAPLCFFFEHFIDSDCLDSFSDAER